MSYAPESNPTVNADLPKHELIGLYLGGKHSDVNKRILYLEEKVKQLIQANEDGTTGGLPFNPTDLTLPVRLWMDASDEETVSVDSSNRVTGWTAKVGGLTLSNADTQKSPTYNSTTLNNLKTLSFDGTDFLQSTANLNVVSSNQTWYLLFKATEVDSAQDALFTYGEKYENGNWQLTAGSDSSFRGRVWKDTSPYTYPPFLSNDNLLNEWHLFTIEFDRENKTISAFVDGTEVVADHEDPYPLNNNGIFKLFRNRANTNSPAGQVAEFMIQPTKNDGNRELIEYYIMEKWGLLSNLDDSNQYKDGTVEPSGGGSEEGQFIEDRQESISELGQSTAGMAFRISSVDGNAIIDPTRTDLQRVANSGNNVQFVNPSKFYGGISLYSGSYSLPNRILNGTFWDIRGSYVYEGRNNVLNTPTSGNSTPVNEFLQISYASGLDEFSDLNDSYYTANAPNFFLNFSAGQAPVRMRYKYFDRYSNTGRKLEISSGAVWEQELIACPLSGQCRSHGFVTHKADTIFNDYSDENNGLTFFSEDGRPVTGEFGPNAIVEHWDGADWTVALPNPDCDYTTEELAKIPSQYRSSYSSSGNANGSCAINGNLNYNPTSS